MSATSTRKAPADMDRRIRQRRRQVHEARARRRRRAVTSVFGLLVLAAVTITAARSPLFAITEIRVVGTDRTADVRAASGLEEGENLLTADVAAAGEGVEALGWVRTAAVARLPPSAVEIAVDVREPLAVVRLADSSWVVDAEGVVLAGGDREDLVAIDAPESVLPGVGMPVSDAPVRNAIAVHAQLPTALRGRVLRYDAPSVRGLRLLVDERDAGVWVRFGRAERVETKAQVVDALLEQARDQGGDEDGSVPAGVELDVRAPDNPVLVPGSSGDEVGQVPGWTGGVA